MLAVLPPSAEPGGTSVHVGPLLSIDTFGTTGVPQAESLKSVMDPLQVPPVGMPHAQGEQ